MVTPRQSDVKKQLAALQLAFKQSLPGKITELEKGWASILSDSGTSSAIEDCYRMAHTLVGSAGTFGAMAVSSVSREVEQEFKSFLSEDNQSQSTSIPEKNKKQITALMKELKGVADRWSPSEIPFIKPEDEKEKRGSNLIYLAEDDKFLAADLVVKLEEANFRVEHFSNIKDFEKAFDKEIPSAVIMDVVFREGSVAGAEVISQIKCKVDKCPPVIFISVRNDMEARLAAARAGALRYLCKPIDINKLILTLDGLIERTVAKPFRVLLVDDDESLLSYYETVLRGVGMEVKTLSRSLESLKTLEEFKPDVIVLDVHMPECSGPEVAQVIRQDDSWALTPIMYLSTESNLGAQIEAINFGAENFMVKPVSPEHLVAAVTAKAKRSRWSNRLNKDLELALRESEFQLITSNQHDIVSTADVSGKIMSVNDKFCEISGYGREELLGQNHRLLKSGRQPDSFFEEMWNTILSGSVWHGTICNLNKNGDEYWVESTIVPFLDEKGIPYKYVSARTDITRLRASEERLERSQTFANIGTWDWNIKTGDLYWSERIWPLFGYKKSETKTSYDNFLIAVHPEDRQKVMMAVDKCVKSGDSYNIEHRVLWPDHSVHWVHESGDVIRSENGEALHMLGVVRDIDTRKRAELALIDSELQLRDAQTLARIGNWQADIITGELNWSDEIYRLFGYEPGSFAPSVKAFHAAIHPDDLERVLESEKRAEQTGLHDVEHRIVLPDGTINYVHELAKAETDIDGQLLRMSGTVQDITERVTAEAKQREVEERFEFAVEGAGDGVWDWDMQTNVMQFSKTYMEMLGYVENELENHVDTWVNSVHPDDLPNVQKTLQKYLEQKIPNYIVELRLRCKDDSYKWILCRGTVVDRDAENNAVRMIGIHSDITKRKENEHALIESREEAETANRAKSEFLSSMSHELRTPMNAIMGFGQLLGMEVENPLTASQQENVTEILKASDHLLELINEVLDLAKIEAGRIDLSIEDVQAGSVITESLQLILPLAEKRGISIKLLRGDTEISVSELSKDQNIVRADHTRMKQVIINLLSNAVKYNVDNGKITISCGKSENQNLRISISDTGKGLSQEQSEQLFTAFNRLGAEHTEIEGTGIGLVITKNIVELMGGRIGFECNTDAGSTFWFELPCGTDTFDNDDVDMPSEVKIDLEEARTVLYIEDNPANLRLVTQLLGRLPNIHMWSAHEPKLGLELAAEHQPDLILLDINLPGMDGYEVLKILRQHEGTRDTSVVAISANAMPKDIEKGIEAGFDDYITKPIDIGAFLIAIDENLKKSNKSD